MLHTESLINAINKVINGAKDRLTVEEYNTLISVKECLENIESDKTVNEEIRDNKRVEQFSRLAKISIIIKDIIDHFL